jgi:phenylpyruvate tautomerase PptA (4-oxalocrotonate tautomerase family)
VPHLHIDLSKKHPLEVKRDLAKHLGNLYAEIMQTTPDLVSVTFRELGEGHVWSCRGETPQPGAVMSLDIRRGRPPEQRQSLAEAVMARMRGSAWH